MYSLNDPDHTAHELYAKWQQIFVRPLIGFDYFSRPTLLQTIRRGFANPYQLAWDIATHAGEKRLAALLRSQEEPADIICHSLGSVVALSALKDKTVPCRRVLILGGAAYDTLAEPVRKARPDVEFYNIHSPDDRVLSMLGSYFGPVHGATCLGMKACFEGEPNWRNFIRYRTGHQDYYTDDRNWPLYRSLLGY